MIDQTDQRQHHTSQHPCPSSSSTSSHLIRLHTNLYRHIWAVGFTSPSKVIVTHQSAVVSMKFVCNFVSLVFRRKKNCFRIFKIGVCVCVCVCRCGIRKETICRLVHTPAWRTATVLVILRVVSFCSYQSRPKPTTRLPSLPLLLTTQFARQSAKMIHHFRTSPFSTTLFSSYCQSLPNPSLTTWRSVSKRLRAFSFFSLLRKKLIEKLEKFKLEHFRSDTATWSLCVLACCGTASTCSRLVLIQNCGE